MRYLNFRKWVVVCLLLLVSTCFLQSQNQKIVILEGLERSGKSTLVKRLSHLLGERASVYCAADFDKDDDLSVRIEQDGHEVILLDGSWLSKEAKEYASGKEFVQNWPKALYFPTHLFVINLPEKKKVGIVGKQETTDFHLNKDALYRKRYFHAYRSIMEKLKWNTLCLEIDRDVFSTDELVKKIVNLIDLDLSILNPRDVTKSNKREVRPFYLSWEAHLDPPIIDSSEYIKILPNAANCNIEKKKGGQFENIDQPFKYSCFSEPRSPPVSIGMLENKEAFDHPFLDKVWQIQDLPIAFPTESMEQYEYRLPKCLEAFTEFVKKTADVWQKLSEKPNQYYAYLTISHDIVPPFKSQRRPSIHCDGFKSARIQEGELGQYAFVAANAIPTIYYIEPFYVDDLDPAQDDYFVAFSKRSLKDPIECQSPYEIMMLDPYTLHSARPNMTLFPVRRTFVRIIFSTRIYDRIGNAHNPAFEYEWEMVPRDMQLKLKG